MRNAGQTLAVGVVLTLVGMLPLVGLAFVSQASSEQAGPPVSLVSDAPPPFALDGVTDDVLWLARCIYSETKRADEQELVAWVVRNRVETAYRGVDTYRETVLDAYQFSAFNPGNPKRRIYTSLAPDADSPAFVQALEVAHAVYHAPASARPFPGQTRHFYSERSMVGRSHPVWSEGHRPVRPVGFQIDPRRFRFYSGVASGLPLPALSAGLNL